MVMVGVDSVVMETESKDVIKGLVVKMSETK